LWRIVKKPKEVDIAKSVKNSGDQILRGGAMLAFRTFCLLSLISMLFQNSQANAQPETSYVDKQIEAKLQSSIFLTRKYFDSIGKRYRPYIDFARDCGVDVSSVIEHYKQGDPSFLVSNVASLGERIKGYPSVLMAIGKWDNIAEKRHSKLEEIYNATLKIANSNGSRLRKLQEAQPYLLEAEKISKQMAKSAGVAYEGGCGAGPEDSQKIDFVIIPKPKSAFYIVEMDFDQCRMVLKDPYDTEKCESWTQVKPTDNELSGRYLYHVTWPDGSFVKGRFSALGTLRKTERITKP
jgi:hypothetical protein